MFKNKKLPKIQILSLVASLTIFVGGSFNNEVMGSPSLNIYKSIPTEKKMFSITKKNYLKILEYVNRF